MFKPHTVLGLGLWLIAIRFIGVPLAWRNGLYIVTGIVLVLIYLRHLWKETVIKLAEQQTRGVDTFTQNTTQQRQSSDTSRRDVAP